MILKKKLIEVALPLPEINDASAYDKMPGIGPHPKGIHHWWARLPLPTARAVLFASLIDDPSEHPEKWPTQDAQDQERERLFGIIRRLCEKRLHERPEIYEEAQREILRHCDGVTPVVVDPFAGGGSIPLEAGRLGLTAEARDLNPVAALLNRCNLELAPRWLGFRPLSIDQRNNLIETQDWGGNKGLAADLQYYANRVSTLAKSRVPHYQTVESLETHEGTATAPIVAKLWMRTVASPNPAARGAHVPLASSYLLAAGDNESSSSWWVDIENDASAPNGWRAHVRNGPLSAEKQQMLQRGAKSGRDFQCCLTHTPIPRGYIQAEGKARRLRLTPMAVVVDVGRGRRYLSPPLEDEWPDSDGLASDARATFLAGELPTRAEITGGVCTAYGIATWGELYTDRQLHALLALSDAIREIADEVFLKARSTSTGWNDELAQSYARTVQTFLSLALDRTCDFNNTLCRWSQSNQKVMNTFGKQALPMVFDFAEANIFGDGVGAWRTCSDYVAACVEVIAGGRKIDGKARQEDTARPSMSRAGILVSTDPPYYDNISYSTLSNFFYVWLRRTLGAQHDDFFKTVFAPKQEELIAAPDRFGGKEAARTHFENGFKSTFMALRDQLDVRFPMTVYYAYKQSDVKLVEDDPHGTSNRPVDSATGWETLLEALVAANFQITATWPVRASQQWRMVSMGKNALATYIVLACRRRSDVESAIDRRRFIAELRAELPAALRALQQGNVAPVDLAQAAIGPGMAVYTRYHRVVDSTGKQITVREALSLVNQTLDEVLAEQDGDFDMYSRWAMSWFEQHAFEEGDFGVAETLSKAKNTSVDGMVAAGLVASKRGRVWLLRPRDLSASWVPHGDDRLTVWELVHHLIRLQETGGERAAASLLAMLGDKAEIARELCYRLYKICEAKKWALEALPYNALVQSWPEIMRLSREMSVDAASAAASAPQTTMFDDGAKPKKKRTKGKN